MKGFRVVPGLRSWSLRVSTRNVQCLQSLCEVVIYTLFQKRWKLRGHFFLLEGILFKVIYSIANNFTIDLHYKDLNILFIFLLAIGDHSLGSGTRASLF